MFRKPWIVGELASSFLIFNHEECVTLVKSYSLNLTIDRFEFSKYVQVTTPRTGFRDTFRSLKAALSVVEDLYSYESPSNIRIR